MQRDIDVGLLRAFVAVAETGRMTRAARVIHITQSAVSQRIQKLEALLNLGLFERRSDAALLTVAPFLRRTVPNRLSIIEAAELPALPQFFVNLRRSAAPATVCTAAFVHCVREGFASRYA